MSMSAHATTMRRQDRQQDEQKKNYLKNYQKLLIRSRVHTQRRLTASLSPTNQRAESKGKCWHPRDLIVVCAVHARPSTDSRALLTNQIRTWIMSLSQGCRNVVLSFLHTSPNVSFILISSSPDFDVLNQQLVVVMTDFIRMLSGNVIVNVFKSDAVIWCAAIFRNGAPPSADFLATLCDETSSRRNTTHCLSDMHFASLGCQIVVKKGTGTETRRPRRRFLVE